MHRHLFKTRFSPSIFLPIKITHFPFSILPCKVPNRTFTCKSPNHENPNFDFKAYMLQKVKLVNHALESTVPLTTNPYKIHESMRFSLLSNGKRICPIVCLAACHLVGGDESAAMPTACALEMIHAMSLMHDDLPCMDDDSLRRGKPSNHVVFGENITVLAGRSLIALAFEHITTATKGFCSAGRILRVIEELGLLAGPQGIFAGQVVDLDNKSDIGLEQLKWIHLHKTAALVEASIVAGAVLGGAGEEEIERLRKYARCAGLMYQVVDDVLDVTKSSKELGKTAGKDLVGDKVTFPKLIGIEKSRDFVIELNVEAQEQLIWFDQERAAPLIALANFIVQREK